MVLSVLPRVFVQVWVDPWLVAVSWWAGAGNTMRPEVAGDACDAEVARTCRLVPSWSTIVAGRAANLY